MRSFAALHTVGQSSVSLESNSEGAEWGILHQRIAAGDLAGRMVEFSADLRTEDVVRGANLFVRADDASGRALAIETIMENRISKDGLEDHLAIHRIAGDTDWTTRYVVLRVPEEATALSYGVALQGSGKLWIDNGSLQPAGPASQITGFHRKREALDGAGALTPDHALAGPANLDFEPTELDTCLSKGAQ